MGRDIVLLEGWNTYKLDLWQADVVDENYPIQRSWLASAPNRLRFDPSELNSDLMPATVQIDWFKLTAMDEVKAGGTFNIEYEPVEAGVDYAFYYDTDTNPNNGRTFIYSTALATTTQSVAEPLGGGTESVYLPLLLNNYAPCTAEGCYAWNTTGVPANTYYICIEAGDGLNLVYRCSEAPMIVR
jgi:hypothetical protein